MMPRYHRFICWMGLLAVLLPVASLHAQTVRVVVIDALNGKPQKGAKVEFFCVGPPRNELPPHSIETNSEGVAEVPYRCTGDKKLELSVIPVGRKEQCGGPVVLGFDEISSLGIISNPSEDGGIWCPTRISKKLKPVVGQVVIFVKKPTWWQSHVAG
jgi:hypothetical protein